MKRLAVSLFFCVCMLALPTASHAFNMVADGNLTDWEVVPGAWSDGPHHTRVNSSDWIPGTGIKSTVEDYDPKSNNDGYLNPGYGGQLFDAEAMYATYDSNNFYYAIVTGHPPEGSVSNGVRLYAGDIAFDFGNNGSFEYGIETLGANAGTLYSNVSWNNGMYYSKTTPAYIQSGTASPYTGQFVYNRLLKPDDNTKYLYDGDHYVIEGYIPLSAFGNLWGTGQALTIRWTETCGNDDIKLTMKTPTPEPATMGLFAMGLAGLGFLRRKQNKA